LKVIEGWPRHSAKFIPPTDPKPERDDEADERVPFGLRLGLQVLSLASLSGLFRAASGGSLTLTPAWPCLTHPR